MKYRIISQVEINADSETDLKNKIESVNSFVLTNEGKVTHIIRTDENL